MRAVFLGTPVAAVPTLQALHAAGHEVALVVTRPDRPVGRSGRLQAPPVKRLAERLGLPVLQPTRVRDLAFREAIEAGRPDVLVVVAYGRILPRTVLSIPRLGPINVHFSLLPLYRGAAPLQWALARGETRTGVTTMFMNERMDEGDLLLQRSAAIRVGEHAPALGERMAALGAELLLETLAGLAEGRIEPRPQDHAAATAAPLLSRDDGRFDPAWSVTDLVGRVRGFDPWPGVWARCAERRIRILEADVMDGACSAEPPGTLLPLQASGLPCVTAGGGVASIVRLQPEGRRAVDARDAVNGRVVAAGQRLGPG